MIHHGFERRFFDLERREVAEPAGQPGVTQFKDPVTGRWRGAGTQGVHCGEIPFSGTYIRMECQDGNEYYEFTAFQAK